MLQSRISLPGIRFEHDFVQSLPGDSDQSNTLRQVQQACYSHCLPTPAPAPTVRAVTIELAESLGFTAYVTGSPDFAAIFSGSALTPEMQPYAMCYGGHQFGSWAGQLGDGRAINLGELPSAHQQSLAVQLKGAGPTPYSRRADGFAVLRSSLREFVCSEAMHALGIPTTRALALVTTGTPVLRDILYDGHPKLEPGAVVTRTAESFVRFGNFEIFAARGDHETLRKLADYVLRRHFPNCVTAKTIETASRDYLAMFREICRRTARLIAQWQCAGFVHGVMNTDNMSITGLTIDYGPYGWLEPYDLDWTPNTTDAQMHRYVYGNQPAVGAWNIARLAAALHPLIGDTAALQAEVGAYADHFEDAFSERMQQKLGLTHSAADKFVEILTGLEGIFAMTEIDMTLFFRILGMVDPQQIVTTGNLSAFARAFYDEGALDGSVGSQLHAWFQAYAPLTESDLTRRRDLMHAVNPKYVLRNYLAQQTIEAAEAGDYQPLERLIATLQRPYDEQPNADDLAQRRPEWARNKPGASALSCSS